MNSRLEKETKGAWVIHHGRKIALDISAPGEFPVLDESAKAAELLVRLGQSDSATMRLLKREIGELALQVLIKGDANAEAITVPPSSPMTGYVGPEESRMRVRRNQRQPSKRATHDILSALRGGRAI